MGFGEVFGGMQVSADGAHAPVEFSLASFFGVGEAFAFHEDVEFCPLGFGAHGHGFGFVE